MCRAKLASGTVYMCMRMALDEKSHRKRSIPDLSVATHNGAIADQL